MPLKAVTWFERGPFGGDARSFGVDPRDSKHLFLGSATGWIFESVDGGKVWKRLSRVGKRDDLVLAHILVDPADTKHIMVGAYAIDHPDGGLFDSRDGGMTWHSQAEMTGQSVRALAAAPSDPKMLIAGTLLGVYRSTDSGNHWTLISPQGSVELREIESVAIDPTDPKKIIAGTWHLPWRTVDGGANWLIINEKEGGIHDDSDIFSIIIDPHQPQTVYASACSGIYKSVNGGIHFERTRADQLGMDHMALRTRKLTQDPTLPGTVFAGTTEGLWRTLDAGAHWVRLTARTVIVNDVHVDPANAGHVLIATDRGGVLTSSDNGASFQDSNSGFSARQVTSFAGNPHQPSTVYAGVVNDKTSGGVFMSLDGGINWQQQSLGLNGSDVFSLVTTAEGTLLAGTQHGMFRMDNGAWSPSSATPAPSVPVVLPGKFPGAPETNVKLSSASFTDAAAGKKQAVAKKSAPALKLAKPAMAEQPHVDAVVYAMASVGDLVYAGTSDGLMQGTDDGRLWTPVKALDFTEPRFVAAQKNTVMVASLRRMALSVDGARTWDTISLPAALTHITTIAVDEIGNLWVGGPEGVFYSTDFGLNWKTLRNLYMTQVSGIYFDPVEHRVLVTALNSTVTFAAHLPDYKVNYWDSGWNLRFVRPVGDHLVGVTMYDGVVVQPKMVDSAVADAR